MYLFKYFYYVVTEYKLFFTIFIIWYFTQVGIKTRKYPNTTVENTTIQSMRTSTHHLTWNFDPPVTHRMSEKREVVTRYAMLTDLRSQTPVVTSKRQLYLVVQTFSFLETDSLTPTPV